MKMRLPIVSLIMLIILITLQVAQAQDFESDLEVHDIRTRVIDATWEIVPPNSYTDPIIYTTTIQFTVQLELWNPYDRDLVSFGSSSCRWSSSIEIHGLEDFEFENFGEACTADYGPRTYPSGISTEVSHPEISFFNESFDEFPNSNITINGQGGNYENNSDNSFGMSIGFYQGTQTVYYESIPSNWGEILYFEDESDAVLNLNAPFILITISTIIIISRKSKF